MAKDIQEILLNIKGEWFAMGVNLVEQDTYCRRCEESVTLMEKHVAIPGTSKDKITSIECIDAAICVGSDCEFAGGTISYTNTKK